MSRDMKVIEDVRHRIGAVEDVEVDAGHAVGPEVLGLAGGVLDTDFSDHSVIFGEAFEAGVQLRGDGGTAQ